MVIQSFKRRKLKMYLLERLDAGNKLLPYFLILPVLLLILLIGVYPILDSVRLSLLDNPLVASGMEFVGLRNYQTLFANPDFTGAVQTTLIFSAISVTLELLIGLGIALLINNVVAGRGLVRAAILVPWAFPAVVSAQIWSLMFSDRRGIITYILQVLHLLAPDDTLLSTNAGIITAAVMADVWKTTPFMALLLLAGLQMIPKELHEAASVDGGSRMQRFWYITFPMLTGPLLIALLFRAMECFRVFDIFFQLAGNQVLTVASYAYFYMFSSSNSNFSVGAAAAIVLLISGILMGLAYILLQRARQW